MKKNEAYNKFYKKLITSTPNSSRRSSLPSGEIEEKMLAYWCGLSDGDKRSVVKSLKWNYYPMYSYWSQNLNKRFGPELRSLVSSILLNEKDKSILVRHSQGLFAIFTMDKAPAKERIFVAKRVFGSSDRRLVYRACAIVPISYAKKALNNQSMLPAGRRFREEVVQRLIKRVGFNDCYAAFIPKDIGIRPTFRSRKAIELATREEVEHLIEKVGDSPAMVNQYLLRHLVRKFSAEEVIFNLGRLTNGVDEPTRSDAVLILEAAKTNAVAKNAPL
jgi:hypothetical protein